MKPSVYVMRIAPGRVDMVPEALASDQLIIGWTEAFELLDPALDRDDFREVIHRLYHPGEKTRLKAGHAAANLWTFLRLMQVGDVVLVPHGDEFYIAQVTGEAWHDAAAAVGSMRRPVEWLNAGGPLRRRDFPLVDNRLKERATVYSLTWGSMDFLEEIQPYLASDAVDDIEQVERRPNLDPTTRKALVNARLGQGQYRSAMLSKWGNACAATGCTLQAAIRASHAKPWRLSSDEERLDSNNGLPLVATLDALFDRGLIVIEEDGAISSRLSADDQEILQVPAHLVRKPSKSQAAYLRFHREYFRGKRD